MKCAIINDPTPNGQSINDKRKMKTHKDPKNEKNNRQLIVVLGPTASGKSDCAVEIAKLVGGEVISADSRQVYRGMDIGTGKITSKEMREIPHYLLDVASPRRQFTVVQYQKLAKKAIQDILKRGKIPIICGGTGLYIDALLEGWDFPKTPLNKTLRKKLEKKTVEELCEDLKKLDPQYAKKIDQSNKRRLVRALEIILSTKSPIEPLKKNPLPYPVEYIGLFPGWNVLKEKIHARLESRLKEGMAEEIKKLHEQEKVSWKRLESFGLEYKFIALYLQNKLSYEKMKNDLEMAIFHYAKRQMTWFKRNGAISWFTDLSDALDNIPILLSQSFSLLFKTF